MNKLRLSIQAEKIVRFIYLKAFIDFLLISERYWPVDNGLRSLILNCENKVELFSGMTIRRSYRGIPVRGVF